VERKLLWNWRRPEDYGTLAFETGVPVIMIPAFAFLYLLGHAEKQGYLRPALGS